MREKTVSDKTRARLIEVLHELRREFTFNDPQLLHDIIRNGINMEGLECMSDEDLVDELEIFTTNTKDYKDLIVQAKMEMSVGSMLEIAIGTEVSQ